MEQLFGSQLHSRSGPVATSSLSAKYKLIYFSAHWCPPCRQFTPQLALFYEQVNASSHQVDIVFVSYDRTPDQFNEYFATMPWLALPFTDRQRAQALGGQFGANGIPFLVLIDNQGRMKSNSCRDDVMKKGPQCLAVWDRALNN
jgi:nucleoredoxin